MPDSAQDAAALNGLVAAVVAFMPEAVVRDGEQPGHHIIYFARQGNEFPPLNAVDNATQ